ncbi:hypothetical protein ALC53_05996 [Atta colombica]|uniref:Uncharacterized protein n=1 Tax=Atta colombica TaxID=520822 RepID=A0A195BHF1_9HYME|nr:hypothetical protein ALC53_05996 [Atta colombica]
MARYRTWDLPMNNEILSCAGNRDTSENARENKSVATAAKGLLFRFCRGNSERTTTLTTLEGWFVPAGYISYFAIFAMVPDGLAVSLDADDDEKDDDDDDDAVRSAVRQHLCPDRVDESLPREVSGGGLRSPIEDGGGSFNIWTCSGFVVLYSLSTNKIRSTYWARVGEKVSKGEIILLSITLNTPLAHQCTCKTRRDVSSAARETTLTQPDKDIRSSSCGTLVYSRTCDIQLDEALALSWLATSAECESAL